VTGANGTHSIACGHLKADDKSPVPVGQKMVCTVESPGFQMETAGSGGLGAGERMMILL